MKKITLLLAPLIFAYLTFELLIGDTARLERYLIAKRRTRANERVA